MRMGSVACNHRREDQNYSGRRPSHESGFLDTGKGWLMQSGLEFPTASDGDSGRLALVLQTANAFWKRGDQAEALRWVRRAVESAEEEGNDLRALALARAAAEIRDRTGITSIPASARSESSVASRPPLPLAPHLPPQPARPEVDTFDEETPVPSMRAPARASSPPPSASVTSQAADRHTPSEVRPAPSRASRLPPPPVRPPPRTSRPPPPSRRTTAPGIPIPRSAVEPTQGSAADAPHSEAEIFAPARAALRVSVMLLSAESKTLLVRVLDEAEALPSSCREALLVPVASGIDLRKLPDVSLATVDNDSESTQRYHLANHRTGLPQR